jgi:hypothetical protein
MTVPYTFATATSPLPLSQLDANFSAVGQSANISYTYSSANAVTRTSSSKMSDFVSILDFGAKGDGVADDTAAFSYAILTNKNIFIPSGTYRITSSINIPSSCSTIFIGEGNIPVPTSILLVDFNGSAFVSSAGNTAFYCFKNLFCKLNNPSTNTSGAFLTDSGASIHCEFTSLSLYGFKNPAISLASAFVCKFDHVLVQYCYNYGIVVSAGSDCRFESVAFDHTYGGGMNLLGSGFVIANCYWEYCSIYNDPATFNQNWSDLKLYGGEHTVIGGLFNCYPQNNKAPIALVDDYDVTMISVRGYALGTGAPSYILRTGTNGGLSLIQCPSLTYSGVTTNVIEILSNNGLTTHPDIKFTPTTSVWGSIARSWACFNGTTATLKQSANVDSVTRNGTGDYTVTLTTGTFSNSNFVALVSAETPGVITTASIYSKTTNSVRVIVNNSASTAAVDSTDVMVAVIGI